MAHPLRLVESEHDGLLTGTDWPLIPDGEYLAICTGWQTAHIFRSAKLYLHFRIVEEQHQGAKLFAPFRVYALVGKPGVNGRFKASRRSRLVFMLATLTGQRLRGDRLSVRWLTNCMLRVKTRTVLRNYEQCDLPQFLRYSIVHDIVAVEAGAANVSA
ncbi:MAG: hypothetical protein M0Z84_07755 [Gammaproteobacteria bacterium]|nr:hypothetical protein [Gammaproteobacteria bacterium]